MSPTVSTLILIGVQAIGLLVLDIATPIGIAVWIMYLIPLGLTSWLPHRQAPFIAAAVFSLFLVTGYLLSPPGMPTSMALLNHALGLCTLWVTAVLLYRHKRHFAAELHAEVSKRQEVEEQLRASQLELAQEREKKLGNDRQKVRRLQDRQLLQRSRDLELASKVSEALLREMPGDLIIEQGLRTAVAAAGAEAGAIFLMDLKSRKLVFTSVIGEKAEVLADCEMPPGGSIAEAVFASGEPELIADAQMDRRHNTTVDLGTGFRTRSMLVVPLKLLGEEPIGVLEVLNKRSGTFNQGDLQLLTTFSTLLTAAIEHTRLYREQASQAEQLAN